MQRRIIGLSGAAGAGKSTAASFLEKELGFHRVRFAGPLKDMMRSLGLCEREIEGDMKERPCELLGGKTPRYAMQTIGTEWGRDIIAQDLWIRAWGAAVDKLPEHVPVVSEDVRFPNEASAIQSRNGLIVRLQRSGLVSMGHASEGQAFSVDCTLQNDDISMFRENVLVMGEQFLAR